MAEMIVTQVRNHPDAIMELALSNLPKLSMDASSFGEFVQQMSELGLIFDITFTDEQLLKLPDWTLVDEKITLGLSCIYPTVHLPKPPSCTTGSVNGTVWSFVKVSSTALKNTGGRRQYTFIPPARPPVPHEFSLDLLIKEFGLPNPVSRTNNVLPPENIIVICRCRLINRNEMYV